MQVKVGRVMNFDNLLCHLSSVRAQYLGFIDVQRAHWLLNFLLHAVLTSDRTFQNTWVLPSLEFIF